MIVAFNNQYLENLFTGDHLKGKPRYNEELVKKYKKTIIVLKNTENSNELKKIRSLNFEALKGNRKGQFSVRIDIRYRLIFKLIKDQIELDEIAIIEELSKHYE